jgi:hypothetical protein
MSATILPCGRLRAVSLAMANVGTGFAALGQSWLDAIQLRCGPPEPEWSPIHRDADEELRLMVALNCATFH